MLLLLISSIVFVLQQPILVHSFGNALFSADEIPACNMEFNLNEYIGMINKKICEIIKYNQISKHLNDDQKLIKIRNLLGEFLCENKNIEEKKKIQQEIRMEFKKYLHSKTFKLQSEKAFDDLKKEEVNFMSLSRKQRAVKQFRKMWEEEKKLMEKIECHLSDNGDELWLKTLFKNTLKEENDSHPLFIITTKIWEKIFDEKNGIAFKIIDIADGERQLPFNPLANVKYNKISRVKRQNELIYFIGLLVLAYCVLIFIGIFSMLITQFAPVIALIAFIFMIMGFLRGMMG